MSNLLSKEQLEVKHTQPHHITIYDYPYTFEADDAGIYWEEVSQLQRPRKHTRRYDPLEPHIEDETVKHNTGWEDASRVSFWSINAATNQEVSLSKAMIRNEAAIAIDALASECDALQTAVGVTRIMACLVEDPQPPPGGTDDDPGEFWVWVRRNTSHRQSVKDAVAVISSTKFYRFPYEDLVESKRSPSLVLRTLYHLINGISGRAVQHSAMVRKAMGRHDVALLDVEWLRSRAIRMDEVVSRKVERVVPATIVEGDRCAMCEDQLSNIDYDDIGWSIGDEDDVMVDADAAADVDPHHDAVRTRCHHLFGRSCLENVYESLAKPLYFECPVCQQPVLTQLQIDSVVWGLRNGEYHNDTKFTEFENFQRSCADLDNYKDADLAKRITMNRPIFKLAWSQQLEGSQKEHPSSTPLHLQAVHSPEMKAVDILVREYLSAHGSYNDTVKNFAGNIIRHVHNGLLRIGLKTLQGYLTHDEIQRVQHHLEYGSGMEYINDDLTLLLLRRPWLIQYVRILVMRCLRFLVCRRCRCEVTEDYCFPLHKHGERSYYDTP